MVGVLLPYVNETMSELTLSDADEIEVESFYDGQSKQTRDGKLEVDRWSKYGHDRLYINAGISKCDKYTLYVDLQTHEIVSDNDAKHSGGNVEIEGDTATITIEESGDKEHKISVSLQGDGFEAEEDDDADEDEDETELVCDGGRGVTDHVEDETIEVAIKQHDDPDHEDSLTVADVRELLAHVQVDTEMSWGEWTDNIERGDTDVVAQDADVLVFDTGEHDTVGRALETYDGSVVVDDIAQRIVSAVHHRVAEEVDPEYNWGVTYPHVARLPAAGQAGQQFVEAIVNSLQRRGLSPGQAWAYYGVEIRDESRSSWGKRKGDHDHKNVSDALEKAKAKLREGY